MVQENDWPRIEACVIDAARIIGQLAHPTSSTTLTEQTTLLQSGLKRLLTAEQFSGAVVQARANMAILEYQPPDLLGLVCQVAFGQMHPTTTLRQDVAVKLMTVLLSSPAYVGVTTRFAQNCRYCFLPGPSSLAGKPHIQRVVGLP